MSSNSYHDVLGIRPNAGREEIELAYKGRRSQYHPDRYAQADADTQAWATRCMQEVNAAYAALANGHVSTPASEPRPGTDKAPDKGPMQVTFADALRAHSISKRPMERIYLAPNIPLKKLHNALESYGDGLKPSEVLVLLDDTIFSSGKDGLLLTEHQLWIKEAFQPRFMVPLDGMTLELRNGVLYTNGNRVRDFNIVDKDELRQVVQALTESLKNRRVAQDTVKPTPSQCGATGSVPAAGYRLEQVFLEVLNALDKARRESDFSTGRGRKVGNMIALMEVAMALTDKLQDAAEYVRGAPPDAGDLAWLRSDPVRLELLVYEFAWLTYSLKRERGRSDAQVDHDLDLFISYVILPAMSALLSDGDADPEQVMASPEGSALMQALGQRIQHYFDAHEDRGLDVGLLLFHGLSKPIAFEAVSVGPQQRARWEEATRNACGCNSLARLAREMHQVLGMGLDATFGPAA